MNVDSSMCASFGKAAQWEQHDWPSGEPLSQEAASRIVKVARTSCNRLRSREAP